MAANGATNEFDAIVVNEGEVVNIQEQQVIDHMGLIEGSIQES